MLEAGRVVPHEPRQNASSKPRTRGGARPNSCFSGSPLNGGAATVEVAESAVVAAKADDVRAEPIREPLDELREQEAHERSDERPDLDRGQRR
jgi:hypothetical protein